MVKKSNCQYLSEKVTSPIINYFMATLITGGAGYIGSHTIIELFENTGQQVISIDNYSNSSEETYQRIKDIVGAAPEYMDLDLLDLESLEEVFKRYSIGNIIHFAALKSVPESVDQPLKYYENNLMGLTNLLSCCEKFKVGNFIFSSSCSVYGNADELPVTEETALGVAESPYAATKQMGEKILEDFAKANPGFHAISLRYFNPVGAHISGKNGEIPFDRPNNLVPIITQTAAGIRGKMQIFGSDYNTPDGTCIRDYIHVSDIATAHVLALDYLLQGKNSSNYSIFNLGTGKGTTVLGAVKAFEKVIGKKLNYEIIGRRAGDVEAIYANNSKARKELGWVPEYGLEEMMDSAWKWQLNLRGK